MYNFLKLSFEGNFMKYEEKAKSEWLLSNFKWFQNKETQEIRSGIFALIKFFLDHIVDWVNFLQVWVVYDNSKLLRGT